MVIRRFGLALALVAAASLAQGADLSPTASTLPALPARPALPAHEANVAWEDFTAVTLLSAPFTAFWCLLGALVVGGVSQKHFPPDINTPMLAGAGAVAGAASVSIGLFSVQWGGSRKDTRPAADSPGDTPTAKPASGL